MPAVCAASTTQHKKRTPGSMPGAFRGAARRNVIGVRRVCAQFDHIAATFHNEIQVVAAVRVVEAVRTRRSAAGIQISGRWRQAGGRSGERGSAKSYRVRAQHRPPGCIVVTIFLRAVAGVGRRVSTGRAGFTGQVGSRQPYLQPEHRHTQRRGRVEGSG